MRELVLRALLADRVPEWRKATIERVKQGQTHHAFRLTLGSRRAFCKFDLKARPGSVNSRRREASIQRQAAAQGLAPDVLYSDEHCIMTQYLEAKVLDADDLRSHELLRSLGTRLRDLEGMPLSGRRFDGSHAARIYAKSLSDVDMATRCVAAIDAMPADDTLRFSHNDLVAGNILLEKQILFIDWEYACDNSPMFDVATIIAHHGLDADAARVLLDARFGSCDQQLLERLTDFVRGYRALYWLWLANRNSDDRRLAPLAALLQET